MKFFSLILYIFVFWRIHINHQITTLLDPIRMRPTADDKNIDLITKKESHLSRDAKKQEIQYGTTQERRCNVFVQCYTAVN